MPAPPPSRVPRLSPTLRRWLIRTAVGLALLAMLGAALARCGSDGPDQETMVLSAEDPGTSTSSTIPIDEAAGVDRVPQGSDSGITWTMAATPQAAAAEVPGADGVDARAWTVDLEDRTERVLVADLGDRELDLDTVLDAYAQTFEGRTTGSTDLQVAGHPGRTAAMIGEIDGKQAIGYVAIADVGDQLLLASTVGAGADPGALYPTFLQLMGSFRAG